MIALVAAVKAESDPGFVYTVGTHHATPLVYNSVATHHATPLVSAPAVTYTHPVAATYTHPVAATAPLVYTHHPTVYASNACHNEAGQLVPCAHGVAPGSAVYAFNNAAHAFAPVVAPMAMAEAKMEAAPQEEALVSVEKRDAEADPALLYAGYYGHPNAYSGYYGYYGHPFYARYGYAAGCRNNYGALVPCA